MMRKSPRRLLRRELASAGVHAVCLTVPAPGTRVSAKLQRAVAGVRLSELEHHGP